jgi:hypothetical protein
MALKRLKKSDIITMVFGEHLRVWERHPETAHPKPNKAAAEIMVSVRQSHFVKISVSSHDRIFKELSSYKTLSLFNSWNSAGIFLRCFFFALCRTFDFRIGACYNKKVLWKNGR